MNKSISPPARNTHTHTINSFHTENITWLAHKYRYKYNSKLYLRQLRKSIEERRTASWYNRVFGRPYNNIVYI